MSKTILGKNVLTTLEEWVLPQHTALVVVDLQNDFCSQGGRIEQLGCNIDSLQACVAPTMRLVEEARRASVLVIYTKGKAYPNGLCTAPPDLARKSVMFGDKEPLLVVEGTWGYELVDMLKPLPNEVIIEKFRHNAFRGTNLDNLLRSNDIKTVIVSGVLTQQCVAATIRGAIEYDYYVVVPRDCVEASNADLQNAALLVISYILPKGGLTESKHIIDVWKLPAQQ